LAEGETALTLQALQHQVRANPGRCGAGIFLSSWLCVQGQWRRARGRSSKRCGRLDPGLMAMVDAYGEALDAEVRCARRWFEGKTTPLVLGQPTPWGSRC